MRLRKRTSDLAATWVCAVSVFGCAQTRSKPLPDAGVDAGGVTLPDHAAGRFCLSDSDCGTGRCAVSLSFASPIVTFTPDNYCTLECIRDAQCGKGGKCIVPAGADRGECLGSCRTPADCRDGYVCAGAALLAGSNVDGTCQPEPLTGNLADGVAGLACASDSDCEGGQCEIASSFGRGFPGNYCTGRCLHDDECGLGGVCLSTAGRAQLGYCYKACETDLDCARFAYRCVRLTERFGCYPAPGPLGDGVAGQPCDSNGECNGGSAHCAIEFPYLHAGQEFTPAPGGYCTQECLTDAECGAGATCVSNLQLGAFCFRRCELPSDCRDGYACVARGGETNLTDRVCMPSPP